MLFCISLWLRAGFPVLAIGPGEFDDMLFVRLAASLRDGEWLGPYRNVTLAKGAAFSAFIALVEPTGIRLKLAEHAVYLASAWYFAAALSRLLPTKNSVVILFAVLAFNPVVWAAEVGGRVVREGLYSSLSLLLLGGAFRLFLAVDDDAPRKDLRRKRVGLVAWGALAGVFWLTREEGLWLAPAVAIPVVARFVAILRRQRSRDALMAIAGFIGLPLAGLGLVVIPVNCANYVYYGGFVNNEFRSSDFQAAYGALSRIDHDRFQRFVVFPKDARTRAYAVSPAARELAPFFEGPAGAGWAAVGCRETAIRPCDEILSGWFMWALRDAVAAAGHYGNARNARRFYRRLAREVDEACDAGRIPCGPERHTLVPPWRAEYLPHIAASAVHVTGTLLSLGSMSIRTLASVGNAEQLTLFARMTHEPIGLTSEPNPQGARFSIARGVLELQRYFLSISLPLAVAIVIVLGSRRPMSPEAVAMIAILAAVATRIALLAFLDATAIPSNNLLYLSPAVPFALALGPAAIIWAVGAYVRRASDER